jgi:hypothetical protein
LKLKINAGSGEDVRVGFINTDIQNLPDIDLLLDCRDLGIFDNESIDFIVAQRLLEYIPRKDMLPTLKEWYRVLKPYGCVEIRVMDISLLTKALYLNGISSEMGLHDEMVVSLLYGQQLSEYDVKYNGFTSSFLQGVLTGCGFTVINSEKEDFDCIITGQKTV